MTRHYPTPALRNALLATAMALLAGISTVPAFAQASAETDTQTLPVEPHVTQAGPASVADLAEGLLEAVVNISTSQNVKGTEGQGTVPLPQAPEGSPFQDFFDEFFKDRQDGGGQQKVQSLGSGFVIDAAEGIVITNNHVIADADEIEVNFSDGSKLKAELVGTDTKTDIAVLKVDPTLKKLKAVKFGDSDKMRIGDWVMAIGNPFGLGGTVTVGIISARNRDIDAGPYDDFIQTDAAINRGNSGGPLFNMYGEVVGINTAIISPSGGSIGIGFSIPAEMAIGVVGQLREFGETRRGWLGVRIQPVTDEIAESLGIKIAKGALVSGIIKGGPVDNGVVEVGDVIIKFDGKDVDESRELPLIVAESPVGKVIDLVVIRKGVETTVKVTLGRLEEGEKLAETEGAPSGEESGPVATASILGMTVGELDDEARSKFGIGADVSGVVVTEVAPDSAAADRGVTAGDVITEIAQESVATPKDVLDRIAALKEQGRKNALLMLASKTGELRFVTIRMD
ncbi:MAG: DegQ family serine endoprotease [Pseudomonadota bacterium]|nr:DegQ family serine endoprotease [Pseudomonadota bacterium]MDQ2703664.1 DegQ family serine endoprotease [Pseudomonadota bacterium]